MLVVKRYVLLASAAVFLLFCGQVLGVKKLNAGQNRAKVVDDISGYCDTTKALYQSVQDLLLFKIDTWLKSDQRNLLSISKYLGFPQVTRNLLNFAMTELMNVERTAANVSIPNLIQLFLYACDIKYMRDYGPGELVAVTITFQDFLTKFNYSASKFNGHNLNSLQIALLAKARAVVSAPNIAYTASVPLLKNRMLTDLESDNETVRKLQPRFIGDHMIQRDLYNKQTKGEDVIKYHVSILGKIIPDVFGFVQKHMSLMSVMLLRPNLLLIYDQHLQDAAEAFSSFVWTYKEILVVRYLEMKTDVDEVYKTSFAQFNNLLTELVDLLKPNQKLSWTNKEEYVNGVNAHVTKILGRMLQQFGSESVSSWETKKTIKVLDSADTENDARLVSLLQHNVEEALDFLTVITTSFVQPLPIAINDSSTMFDGDS